MKTSRKIGIALIVTGIGMFFFGASLFSYQGPELNAIVSSIGMYSFFLWLPTIIAGIILTICGKTKSI